MGLFQYEDAGAQALGLTLKWVSDTYMMSTIVVALAILGDC